MTGSLDRVRIVQEHRCDYGVAKYGSPRKQQAKAITESVGSRIFFEEPVDRQFAADWLTRIRPRLQCGTHTFDIVAIERGQKVLVGAGQGKCSYNLIP